MQEQSLMPGDARVLFPPRTEDSHKGTYGRVLLAAGSRGMAGAAYFAAKAAYRVGVGLCEILTGEDNRIILQTRLPEAVLCLDGNQKASLSRALDRADTVAAGPGWGKSMETQRLFAAILEADRPVPTVLDADALNLLAELQPPRHTAPWVLTPHAGEAARLLGIPVGDVLSDTVTSAHAIAIKYDAVCVLKGHETVTVSKDGEVWRNHSGNDGMATGGSGDVLTGIIAGLLCTGRNSETLTPVRAAALSVFLHGLAGDDAGKRLSKASVMASDILDAVPNVLRRLQMSF